MNGAAGLVLTEVSAGYGEKVVLEGISLGLSPGHTMAVLGRKLPMEQFFTMPPEMLFVNRLQFGFYSVLARLDVDVDYATVERGFIPQA